jgi:hypothetical protein
MRITGVVLAVIVIIGLIFYGGFCAGYEFHKNKMNKFTKIKNLR